MYRLFFPIFSCIIDCWFQFTFFFFLLLAPLTWGGGWDRLLTRIRRSGEKIEKKQVDQLLNVWLLKIHGSRTESNLHTYHYCCKGSERYTEHASNKIKPIVKIHYTSVSAFSGDGSSGWVCLGSRVNREKKKTNKLKEFKIVIVTFFCFVVFDFVLWKRK